MATGSNTFKGLAVPLQGESNITQLVTTNDVLTITAVSSNASDYFVCEDSAGTEDFYIMHDGRVRSNPAFTTTSGHGFDIRTSNSSNVWSTGLNVEHTPTMTAHTGQCYALRGALWASGRTNVSGREAVLNLFYVVSTTAQGAGRAFIWFDDAGTGPANLFEFANTAVDGASFFNTNASPASTKGLRIMHGADTYYIMITSCTD